MIQPRLIECAGPLLKVIVGDELLEIPSDLVIIAANYHLLRGTPQMSLRVNILFIFCL